MTELEKAVRIIAEQGEEITRLYKTIDEQYQDIKDLKESWLEREYNLLLKIKRMEARCKCIVIQEVEPLP